jgi:Flp pilus assembly CpaE family ATPase
LDVLTPAAERDAAPLQFSRLDDVIRVAMAAYSTVVVDHPDALYSASREVLDRSSFIGIICTPDISALYLVRRKRRAIAALLGREPNRLALIVNRSTSWGSLDRADVERVAEAPIVAALPNDYAAVRRASWQGGLIERDSALAVELLALAERIDLAAPCSEQDPKIRIEEVVRNG